MSEEKFQNVHNIKLISVEIPKHKSNKLLDIKSQLSLTSQKMFDKILLENAYDNKNNYNPKDMLNYLIDNYNGEDFIKNLDEQLKDMYKLGQCPQGQSVRLMSLIIAFTSLLKS